MDKNEKENVKNNPAFSDDENDDEDVLEVKELILKDTSGNGKITKITMTAASNNV